MTNDLKQEIEIKEKELNDLKYKQEQLEAKKIKEEKGTKFFDKHFGLNMVHDDISDSFREYYFQVRGAFIREFKIRKTDSDKDVNFMRLREARNEYISYMRDDITELTNEFNKIIEQSKELKDGNRK